MIIIIYQIHQLFKEFKKKIVAYTSGIPTKKKENKLIYIFISFSKTSIRKSLQMTYYNKYFHHYRKREKKIRT